MLIAFLIGMLASGVICWLLFVEPSHRHIETLELSIIRSVDILDKAAKRADIRVRPLIEDARIELLNAMAEEGRGSNGGTREDP